MRRAGRARAFERRDALLRRLRTTYAKDGLALYLGAGVSASAYFSAGVDVLWVDDFKEIPRLVREIAKGK